MDVIAGGSKKKIRVQHATKEKKHAIDLPTDIAVKNVGNISNIVPGHVWRVRPFKWNPITFATESERLNNKFIEPSIQDQSLQAFLSDPRTPMVYGISGNPDDSKAKYFAAFLVAAHLKALGADANAVWAPMYGGFDNPLMDTERAKPTMLVLTNLTRSSTNIKLEKTRDLIEKYADIPRIVVAAGIDPLSFVATRLYTQINGLAYFSEGLVKQRVEII